MRGSEVHNSCPTQSELLAFQARDLNPVVVARIEQHVASCTVCGKRIAELVSAHDRILGALAGMNDPRATTVQIGQTTRPVGESSRRTSGAAPIPYAAAFHEYEIVRELSRGGQGV